MTFDDIGNWWNWSFQKLKRLQKHTHKKEKKKRKIKSLSTTSTQLSANAPWLQTQRQWPLTLTSKECNSGVKTRFFAFDLAIWPLTYNPNLAKVKVDLHTEYQGRRSNSSAVTEDTDGRTLPSALSPCFVVDNKNVKKIIKDLIIIK